MPQPPRRAAPRNQHLAIFQRLPNQRSSLFYKAETLKGFGLFLSGA
jgi:hypothetical protein